MSVRRAMAAAVLGLAACCSHAAPRPPIDDQADDDVVVTAPPADADAAIDAAAIDAATVDAAPANPWSWSALRVRSPAVQDPDGCKQPSPDTAHLECGSSPFWQLAVRVVGVQEVAGAFAIRVDRGSDAGLRAGWVGRGVDDADRPDAQRWDVLDVSASSATLRARAPARPAFEHMILWDPKVRDMPEVK